MSKKSRGELLRDPIKGKIAGICAGLANYFDMEVWLVRILVVSAFLLGLAPLMTVLYIAAWLIIDKAEFEHNEETPSAYAENKDEAIKVKAKTWQAGQPPKKALHEIQQRFEDLETKIRHLERYVTSDEFNLSREINKL